MSWGRPESCILHQLYARVLGRFSMDVSPATWRWSQLLGLLKNTSAFHPHPFQSPGPNDCLQDLNPKIHSAPSSNDNLLIGMCTQGTWQIPVSALSLSNPIMFYNVPYHSNNKLGKGKKNNQTNTKAKKIALLWMKQDGNCMLC